MLDHIRIATVSISLAISVRIRNSLTLEFVSCVRMSKSYRELNDSCCRSHIIALPSQVVGHWHSFKTGRHYRNDQMYNCFLLI